MNKSDDNQHWTRGTVAGTLEGEWMHELILASPGRAFTGFDFLPFYRDAFRQFVLHKSHDEIGQLNGWRFHRDSIHCRPRAGVSQHRNGRG